MTWTHADWGAAVREARRAHPPGWDALRGSSRRPIHPLRVCAALQPVIDAGATLVCDGGEFGQWVQAGVEAPTRLINGLSGSIGSAIPMAIGARLARPDRPVVAALGDGTFGFHAFELDTVARHRAPVVALVGNDARWNAEHQLQLQHYGADRAVGCELRPTRYDEVARALGGHGELVERPEDLEPALGAGGPACVNVTIDGVAAPTYRAAPGAH
ncbi:MAG TPA: thiamine pyrophosphate-dependent enzyme [Candidatus Limnocylindrales bacterium]|nr:thiamine pyrophosphate-dependent enzyme [Candidatus Limnocylindrales bacterium]